MKTSTTYTLGPGLDFTEHPIQTALTAASTALCAYHGYKRNSSFGWGLAWGMLGDMFPIIAPAIAVAQGFGKPEYVQAKLAALGTNEFTKDLPPHLRARCFEETGSSAALVAALEKAGFKCRVERFETPEGCVEVGECVRTP